MKTIPTFDHWHATLQSMVEFHREQALTWLWLPTPSDWVAQLQAQEDAAQSQLRAHLVPPSTPQPEGLSWYAWDTRQKEWTQDGPMLAQWYSHWAHAQGAPSAP